MMRRGLPTALACLVFASMACSGAAPTPVAAPPSASSAAAPATPIVAPAPAASAATSPAPAPSAAAPERPAPATAAPEPADEGPATGDGLARGTGEPADQELALADAAYEAEKYKDARAHFKKAEQLAPKDPAPKVGLVLVAVAEADLPLDYAAAPHDARIPTLLKQLDAALKLNADFGPALLERGHLLLIQGKAEPASSALTRAAQLMPRHPEAQSAVGVALMAVGQAKESLPYFERAAALDRDNPDRLGNLGAAYLLQGRTPDAVSAFEKAARLAPNNARYQSDLGTAYLAVVRVSARRELRQGRDDSRACNPAGSEAGQRVVESGNRSRQAWRAGSSRSSVQARPGAGPRRSAGKSQSRRAG